MDLQVGFWCVGKNELSPAIFLFPCNLGGRDSGERTGVEMDDLWGIRLTVNESLDTDSLRLLQTCCGLRSVTRRLDLHRRHVLEAESHVPLPAKIPVLHFKR